MFWNILAVLMVVLWNTSVFCSPYYTDIRVCGCRHRSVWLDRYATYYLLSAFSTYDDVQSGLMCKMCFIRVVLLSVFGILSTKFYSHSKKCKQLPTSLKFVCSYIGVSLSTL
jgi:hypothetical protein